MIASTDMKQRILTALPGAEVRVTDLNGGQDHYQVHVVASQFEGANALQRHRLVYAAFQDVMGGALHALSIQTRTPAEQAADGSSQT